MNESRIQKYKFYFQNKCCKISALWCFFVKNKEEMDKSFPPISIGSIYLKNIPIQER